MTQSLESYRLLGRSGLRVSPLSLGAMTFGGNSGVHCSDDVSRELFNLYVERGGNFIDTANGYGTDGGSETLVGQFAQERREQLVIATKYSMNLRKGDPNAGGNHRKNMMQSVEASLKRLKTDYIDLFYLHIWDFRTPVEEILRGFDDLVRSGKILYAGMSDTPAWQVSRMQAIAELRGWTPLVALQISYSLAERSVERDLMPMALEMGLGVLPWSPLASGVLSGKYSRADLANHKEGDFSSRKAINITYGRVDEKTLTIADEVNAVAEQLGKSPAQVALAWTLLNPAVTSPIVGARTVDQLKDNLGALEVSFSEEQIARLNEVSSIPEGFPNSMLNSAMTANTFGAANVMPRR